MALIRKILVPIDFSPCSTAAIFYAATLADELGASVDVLHVVPSYDDFKIGSSAPSAPDALAQAERQMEGAVQRILPLLAGRLSHRTLHGDPIKVIVETAGLGGYDLVLMGTHGRIGRLHAIVGSVAEAVVRNAPCPVLTVRVGAGEEETFADRLHGGRTLADQARG
jgi:nucleotide-binding universal stress UspA family protein